MGKLRFSEFLLTGVRNANTVTTKCTFTSLFTFKHQKQPDWETRGHALTMPQTISQELSPTAFGCFVQEGLESPESDTYGPRTRHPHPKPVFKTVVFATHLSQLITLKLYQPKAPYDLSSSRRVVRINEWD